MRRRAKAGSNDSWGTHGAWSRVDIDGIGNGRPSARRDGAILITGSHRSGSTFVGTALGLADGVAVIREPFHPRKRLSWIAGEVDRFFLHVDEDSPETLRRALEQMVAMRPPVARHVASIRSPRDAAATVRDTARLVAWRATGRRPVFKDPIAFFAAEYLADTLGVEVDVLVRHPAAFAGSLKRLDWQFDFTNLTGQPRLMERHLEPFADELRRAVASPLDVIDQAILLWRVFATVAATWRDERPDFIVTRYEDIAADPQVGMARLYERHGLDLGSAQGSALALMTAAENGTDVANPLEVRRDSRQAAWTWTRRLDPDEISRVRHGTQEAAAPFYGPSDWDAEAHVADDG